MTKVNIREDLNQMDKDTDCQYDLVTLYEACNFTDEDKKDIAKMIADKDDAEVIYDKLSKKYGKDVTFEDDDISDITLEECDKMPEIETFDDLEEGILNPYDDIIDEILMDNVDKIKQGWIFDDYFDKVLEDFKKIAQPKEDDIEILKDKAYKQYKSLKRLYDKNEAFEKDGGPFWYFTKHGVQPGSVPKGINIIEIKDTPNGTFFSSDKVLTTKELNDFEITEKKPENVTEHYYSSADEFKRELTDDLIKKAFTPEQAEWLVNKRPTDAEWLAYGNAGTDDFEYFISYTDKHLNEDTVKTSKGKWVNKSEEGTHGTFDTKKEADAQRKAMFASGWKGESLEEDLKTYYISYKESEGKFKDKYVDLPIRANSEEEAEEKFLEDHPNIRSYDYKVTSHESLKEASYGGAYDIADDEYFTKEDGMEAANEVAYQLEKEFPEAKLEVSDMQLDNHSLYISLTDKDGNEFIEEAVIDMRKIRHPRDLIKKYVPELVEMFTKEIKEFYAEVY